MRLATTLALVLLIAGTAMAETLTINGQILPPPISITKNTDLSLQVTRTAGVLSYSDTGSGWTLASPASFSVTAGENATVNLTIPLNVTIYNGSNTATLNLSCRASQTAAPASKTDGNDCGTTQTTSTTGQLFMALFPTSVSFAADAPGSYTGSVTISVNY